MNEHICTNVPHECPGEYDYDLGGFDAHVKPKPSLADDPAAVGRVAAFAPLHTVGIGAADEWAIMVLRAAEGDR